MKDTFGKKLLQGDIILINFDPTKGHEQGGSRPAIIVSTTSYNKVSKYKHVVPVTRTNRPYPLHIHLVKGEEDIWGDIEVEQERSIDISARPYKLIGHISPSILQDILHNIKLIHGI